MTPLDSDDFLAAQARLAAALDARPTPHTRTVEIAHTPHPVTTWSASVHTYGHPTKTVTTYGHPTPAAAFGVLAELLAGA